MKTLAMVLLFAVFGTVSGWAQLTEPVEEEQMIGEGGEEIVPVLEPVQLTATVTGTRFGFDPALPVVPGRRAQGSKKFTIAASFSGDEVDSFVLYEFVTLEFKPGGGGGHGLGHWKKETEGYQVSVDGEAVSEITFARGDEPKEVELKDDRPGAHPHQMLGLTVKLLDTDGETIAEFVDPWDIQP